MSIEDMQIAGVIFCKAATIAAHKKIREESNIIISHALAR